MPTIDPERLMGDLRELRLFGAKGSGVVRQALTPVDLDSRRWLRDRMLEAGLDAAIDGVGNVIGRAPAAGPALLLGSHTDTQPEGGWLDGAMGVVYALEVARALRESEDTRHLAVDVASWMDEEGTFAHFVGSRSFCGALTEEDVARARNAKGVTLAEALEVAGYDRTERARLDPERYFGYLEAHVEQGGVLESRACRIGIVTDIVGIRAFEVHFEGQQNHAGTTPMNLREDAGMALFRFAIHLDGAFSAIAAENTVWTIGQVRLHPGAESIVPGRAELVLQFRDGDPVVLDRFQDRLTELVTAADRTWPVAVRFGADREPVSPARMDEQLQAQLAESAERHAPGRWIRMPSGAGHDAQILASSMPAAMLFVPSIGGVSHSFAEDTSEADIVLGCRVFADAAVAILQARLGPAKTC